MTRLLNKKPCKLLGFISNPHFKLIFHFTFRLLNYLLCSKTRPFLNTRPFNS
ncbi:DsbB family disulfide bond formation protein [Sporosarcina newyorkensis 2681]|uniref:DsbB family disulfide bond formation protein n=1 Tax=Sporosarcina newyorkensis 2681 TaxID=1027292 RepID=F9DSL1_9BACL|nr:DsbB family disulfide bond formation protein [Sporosarcina newyorkensis 2681]